MNKGTLYSDVWKSFLFIFLQAEKKLKLKVDDLKSNRHIIPA